MCYIFLDKVYYFLNEAAFVNPAQSLRVDNIDNLYLTVFPDECNIDGINNLYQVVPALFFHAQSLLKQFSLLST